METYLYILGGLLLLAVVLVLIFRKRKASNTKLEDEYEKIYPSLEDEVIPKEKSDSVIINRLDKMLEKKKPLNEFLKRRQKNLGKGESKISPRLSGSAQETKNPVIEKGKLLFAIPHKMTVNEPHRCVVRLATSFTTIMKDLKVGTKPKISDVPLAETMKVELLDYTQNADGQGLYFNINSFNSAVQLIELDAHTEWLFNVTPLKTGSLPLLLRISIVKMVNGVERYKQTVKEIITEVAAAGGEAGIETNIDVLLKEASSNLQKIRLKAIDKSLYELYHLLSEYETLSDLENDPKAKMRYAHEMEDLRERISYYEKEKSTLVG